jgi:hypothetical protein
MPNFAIKEKPAATVVPLEEPLSHFSDGTAVNVHYYRSKTSTVEDVTRPGFFDFQRDTFTSGFKKGIVHQVVCHLGEIAGGLTQVDLHVAEVPATFTQPIIMAVGNVVKFTAPKKAEKAA